MAALLHHRWTLSWQDRWACTSSAVKVTPYLDRQTRLEHGCLWREMMVCQVNQPPLVAPVVQKLHLQAAGSKAAA